MLQFFFIVGIVGIIVSGLSIGAWEDSRRKRTYFRSEPREERELKTKIALYSGLIGIISLGIAGLIYSLWK
ncbi:DUF5316 family protein [Heyndrickxia sp. NPDC080065]|uniref:DUF5316 family protein n=1 Tax=Heyndrickxia sp. NPDC080065 TaxID=3390568 RepID=UPI003D0527C6